MHRWSTPLLLVLSLAFSVEAMCFVTSRVLARRGVLYRPAALRDYEGYLAKRDPVLGWVRPPGAETQDPSGSRLVPAFPDPTVHRDCGSLYGDSFTWSQEVGPAEAWGNVLSERLGCRVANYGVPGYGSDQALLRYTRNESDHADFVVLAHLSENVMRNVNRYRALLYPRSLTGFKPRFTLGGDGELKMIALPRISPEQYDDFVREPERFLEDEYFVPGGPSGVQHPGFPYSLTILRAFGHFHVRAAIRDVPRHADFYDASHPSQGLHVTAGIVRAFVSEAEARGQIPVPIVIPTGPDLEHYEATGEWVYQALIDALASNGITLYDTGGALLERIGPRDPCDLFDDCSGHFNAEGYAALGEVVADHLEALGVVASGGDPSSPTGG